MEGVILVENKLRGVEINNNEEINIFLVQKLKLLEKEVNENERNFVCEKEKNEKLKEQFNGIENVFKQMLIKY